MKPALPIAPLASLFLASLFAIPAQAQQQSGPQQEVRVGTSVICDTQQQMERFVAVFDGDADAALATVNKEAGDPNACGVATMAYVVGGELSKARNKEGTFQIVKVVVVGMNTQAGFRAVVPAQFVSLLKIDEIEA